MKPHAPHASHPLHSVTPVTQVQARCVLLSHAGQMAPVVCAQTQAALAIPTAHARCALVSRAAEHSTPPGLNRSSVFACMPPAKDLTRTSAPQAPAPHLDGKHVVFGKLTSGMELLKRIERVGTQSGRPMERVVIADSGELPGR